MKEYILSYKSADLEFLMTGGLKPEYYICKRIFLLLLTKSKWLKNNPTSVLTFLDLTHQIGESEIILDNELTKTLPMKYKGNVRSQFMSRNQFMVQFCDCLIRCV